MGGGQMKRAHSFIVPRHNSGAVQYVLRTRRHSIYFSIRFLFAYGPGAASAYVVRKCFCRVVFAPSPFPPRRSTPRQWKGSCRPRPGQTSRHHPRGTFNRDAPAHAMRRVAAGSRAAGRRGGQSRQSPARRHGG